MTSKGILLTAAGCLGAIVALGQAPAPQRISALGQRLSNRDRGTPGGAVVCVARRDRSSNSSAKQWTHHGSHRNPQADL